MKTFVTSDAHFGHQNIIKFCSRPFATASDMDTYMIDTWNSRVGLDDEIYFLGDFSMGPGTNDGSIAEKLSLLNGKKYVVLGNHDQLNKYGMSGLKQIVEDYKLDIEVLADIYELNYDGTRFVMCHYPMNDWNGKFHNTVHLHGHQHNEYSESRKREQIRLRRYDVGVDMFGGPVELTGDCRYLNDPKGWN